MYPILMAIKPDTSGEFTATVIIAGIAIVLGMLAILIGIFYAFGAIVSNTEKASKARAEKKEKRKAEQMEEKAAEVNKETPVAPPVVEDGISGEIVAAISAAIATICGGGSKVRSIKKKTASSRSSWANAAVQDNTRPF